MTIDISKRLKEVRDIFSLTIVDIQHITKVNKAQYYKYEKGTNIPSEQAIIKIITPLGINIDQFNSNSPIVDFLSNSDIDRIKSLKYNRRYKNPEGQYDYSSRLKELRDYYNMTVIEFSCFCHIHKDQYARYERKKNLPTFSALDKILSFTPFTKEQFHSQIPFDQIIQTKSA